MQQRQREDGRSSGESSIYGRVIEIHVESRKQRLEGEERSRLTSVDEQLLDRQLLAADVGADLKALLKGLSGRDEARLVRHEKRLLRIVGIHLDDEAVGGNAWRRGMFEGELSVRGERKRRTERIDIVEKRQMKKLSSELRRTKVKVMESSRYYSGPVGRKRKRIYRKKKGSKENEAKERYLEWKKGRTEEERKKE